tara:strand:+ start:1434 stop:1874 length:441 start_codon:yes stop_codon:yes gene_type:complete
MIDTDKYEGHTPAPWKAIDDSPKVTAGTGPFEGEGAREHESWWVELNEARCISYGGEGQWQRRIGATYMTMRDAKLVADAPLLLAEVKRLSEIEQEHGRVTIDDWEHKPLGDVDAYPLPYVTVYHGGCEYVGRLRLYKNEDGEVIE